MSRLTREAAFGWKERKREVTLVLTLTSAGARVLGMSPGPVQPEHSPADVHFLFFFVFLGLPLRHIEVPKLGVKSEL